MIKEINWIAFCSQTGTEIVNISNKLQIKPRIIITNNYKKLSEVTLKFISDNEITVIMLPLSPKEKHYNVLEFTSHTIITLNGYLKILPKSFIEKHPKLYNGHPGLITKYPELKGLNPQEKAFNLKHTEIGAVIHRVTTDVDGGEIILGLETNIKAGSDLEVYYYVLREVSLNTWIQFFKQQVLKWI
jgi:folate-dependent phosphoribosylglycinamide formyltransferase PurN